MKYSLLIVFLVASLSMVAQTGQFTLATYNLRYDNADDAKKGNGWKQRCPVIVDLIRFNDFDLFGTQEGLAHQLGNLQDSLPDYTHFGVGRDDGRDAGEHSSIFYKTTKFQLLESGNFWLSTITDRPNKGWDAALPRICTWGLFKVKQTGFMFYYFNLHMDHQGIIARRESAKLVLEKIKVYAKNVPAILGGDFNIDQFDESFTLLNTSGILRDAYETSAVKWAATGTFNSFDQSRKNDSRIDHLFLTRRFRVLRYGILNNSYLPASDAAQKEANGGSIHRFPSDHFPVMIVVGY